MIQVVLDGCGHTLELAPELAAEAERFDLPMICPRCRHGRTWRFASEDPGVQRGKRRPSL